MSAPGQHLKLAEATLAHINDLRGSLPPGVTVSLDTLAAIAQAHATVALVIELRNAR